MKDLQSRIVDLVRFGIIKINVRIEVIGLAEGLLKTERVLKRTELHVARVTQNTEADPEIFFVNTATAKAHVLTPCPDRRGLMMSWTSAIVASMLFNPDISSFQNLDRHRHEKLNEITIRLNVYGID